MKTSNNLHFLNQKGAVVLHQPDDHTWVFDVAENASVTACFLQFCGDLDVTVRLLGEGAFCDINVTYLSNENNIINANIYVKHEYKNTVSNQKIRGIATNKSHVTFDGMIHIVPDAQKCAGTQNHRGLLLSPNAVITATPQLEIWADDVQCAHGSAVGPLNEYDLFYLMARGISKPMAQKMLISGFLNDMVLPEWQGTIDEWVEAYV